jgi:deoxyadenosine/deoxycytidine kinase
MRIFLTGAQGTGKSTLVHAIHDQIGLEVVDSMSLKFLSPEKKAIQRQYDTPEFMEFQKEIFLYCLDQYTLSKNSIFSRSLADSYSYITVARRHTKNPKYDKELAQLIEGAIHSVPTTLHNSLYVYVPIEFPISQEGNSVRMIEPEYQKEVDLLIFKFLQEMNIPFLKVEGTVTERTIQVLEEIGKRGLRCY